MKEEEIRSAIERALRRIAPEAQLSEIRGGEPLRDQLDLDSMDFLNLLIGLHQALGVDIPEADYRELASLDGLVRYLAAKLP